MPKCKYCGFHHATPSYCSNCGHSDPCPGIRMLRLLGIIFGSIIVSALIFGVAYLYIKRSLASRDYPPAPPLPERTS